MEQCLHHRLKGVIDAELPIYGRVIYYFDPSNTTCYTTVRGGTGGTKINLIDCEFSGGTYDGDTEQIVAEGVLSQRLLRVTGDNPRVIIDCYNAQTAYITAPTKIVGGNALNYGDKKRVAANRFIVNDVNKILSETDVTNHLLFYQSYEDGVQSEISDLIISKNRTSLITYIDRILMSETVRISKLERIGFIEGNFNKLPLSIKRAGIGGNATGSVDTLITALRNSGRTSGKIQVDYISANNLLTISDAQYGDVVTTKTYCQRRSFSNVAGQYLAWTDNTIDITLDSTGAETPSINSL